MLLLQLANFLRYNLLQSRITFITLFHCWPSNESQHFVHRMISADQPIYMQFVPLNQFEDWSNLEYRFLRHYGSSLAVYMDMKCEQSEAALMQASQEQIYNQHFHWLLHDAVNPARFYKFFEFFNISVDADVTYVQQTLYSKHNHSVSYSLYDVYSNGNHIGGKLNMTGDRVLNCNLNSCHVQRFLSSLHLRSKYGNRNILQDVTLRVSTVVTQRGLDLPKTDLLDFLASDNETHIDGLARFGFHTLLILRDMLQCKMDFNLKDSWSTSETSGGILGDIITMSADLASAPSLLTAERLHYLSAIIELGSFRSVCMFRNPHNAGIRGDVFFQPFSKFVWFSFGAVLLTTALILWLTFHLEYKCLKSHFNFVPSLLGSLTIAFGEACIQGSTIIPRSSGGRMAYLSLFFVSFIMYNYYTSVVVSSLLNSPVKAKITTMQQLAESSLQVGLEQLSFTRSLLNYSKRADITLFRKRKVESQKNPKLWLPAEQGILRVRDKPGYAFLFEASSGYYFVERHYTSQEICDLNEILFRPDKALYTMLHRNSSYKELVRLKLLRLSETGVYHKHRSHWVRLSLHCNSKSSVINVGIEYVAPLFIMLICAYGFVVLLLLLELAWHRYGKSNLARGFLITSD